MILKLGAKEEGDNIVKAWYDQVSYLSTKSADGTFTMTYDYYIPGTWLKQVPNVGTIRFEYMAEQRYLKAEFRRNLGEEFLNWGSISAASARGPFKREAFKKQ